MPMVPMYQGGVPSVTDSGQTGMSVAQLPTPTFNYAKTMEIASRTFEENLGNVAKVMQTQAARNVKAESDRAEIQVMQIIQNHTIGENGYFNQQGENAAKGYKDAWEGLNKDVDEVYSKLSPWAQQAVKSRLQERMISTQGKMQQWQASQERKWNIDESNARMDALKTDAGSNYGDPEALAKSMASIDQEIAYQQKILGFGPERAKQLRQAHYDDFRAHQYQQWAQDNPVQALTDFQNNRGSISDDVAIKIGSQLWQQAKQPLAMMLAGSVGETMLNKKDFIKESLKPGHRTGIPAIDGLNQAQKVELFSAAYSYAAQNRAAAQADLREQQRNTLAEAADQGYSTGELSREDFVPAYGEKGADEEYEKYRKTFDTNAAMYSYQFMSDIQIQDDLKNAKPVPGSPTYADDKKLYQARIKAAEAVVKMRAADPVDAAISTEQYGFKPINFDIPEKMEDELQQRITHAQTMGNDWDCAPRIFSKDEASQLVSSLQRMPLDAQVDYLSRIARTVGSDGIRMVADQLKNTDRKYAIAMAGFDIPVGDGGKTAGEFYLKGLQLLADKMVKEDVAPETGDRALINAELQDAPDGTVKGLFDSPDALASTAELARGNLLYMRWSGHDADAKDAVAAAVGGRVVTHAQQKTILPRGVDSTGVLDDLLAEQAAIIRKTKGVFYIPGSGLPGTPDEIARRLPQIDVKTESVNSDGSVTYSLIYNGSPVFGPDRQKYTFDLVKPPKDESRPFYQWANGGLAIEGLDSEEEE